MAHTPGPWVVVQHPDGWTIQNRATGAGACVASQYGDSNEANARLIAAAPDLLAALKDAVNWLDDFDDNETLTAARAAILKAEGG